MTYIKRDGKIYEQIISEREIDLAEEEYKLQAWKDALKSDERERMEYNEKIAEIEKLKINDEYKKNLKDAVTRYSGSAISQSMVDEAETNLALINNAVEVEINGNFIQ